jgi:hypothetical protein
VGVHPGIYKGSYNVSTISYWNTSIPWLTSISPSHWYQPSPLGRTFSALLFSHFAEQKKKKEKKKAMTFF